MPRNTKGRTVTPRQAARVFGAFEKEVYNPALAWIREGRLPPELGDGYLAADLDHALNELHGLLTLIRQDAERAAGVTSPDGG